MKNFFSKKNNGRHSENSKDSNIPDKERRSILDEHRSPLDTERLDKRVGEGSKKKRIGAGKRSGSDDLLSDEGVYTFLLRSVPTDRICPRNCKNHRLVIKGRQLELYCETLLGSGRRWVYFLEEPFRDGTLTIYVKEKTFNALMLQLRVGLFTLKDKRSVTVDNHFTFPIINYEVDRGY